MGRGLGGRGAVRGPLATITFVDAMLMEDTPIAMLSLMTGHSVQILQKHYSRIDVMKKSRDLTQLPIGQKKDRKQEVKLWD